MATKKKKILILVGGDKEKLSDFDSAARELNARVTLASFLDIQYQSGKIFVLKVGTVDIKTFDLIYIRLVGKRLEEASLVVNYAVTHKIPIVDSVYQHSLFLPSTISKAVEMARLIDAQVSLPRTFLASIDEINKQAPKLFGFPFVIKSTSGRKAREVWSPKNKKELRTLCSELKQEELIGKKYFAQEFLHSTQRERAFVVGGKVVAAITRPTKWGSRISKKVGLSGPVELTPRVSALALKAAKAVGLDIAGVDIMRDERSGKTYVIEVNAAPAWKLIKKDTGMDVEAEILKFLIAH